MNEQQSTQLNELFAALAKAQAEMESAGLTSANPFFKSKYADLAEIVKASRPSLTKYGLAVVQYIEQSLEGSSVLITLLGHASGQYITSRMPIQPAKTDVQSLGSYITYLRRYSYAALVGVVVCDEDDDGEHAMTRPVAGNQKPVKIVEEYVTADQLADLEYELEGHLDIAENVMRAMKITTLSQFPRDKYQASIRKIRELKLIKEQNKAA